MELKTYKAVSQVLGERKYAFIFFSFALFFFALFVFIPVATIPGNTLTYQLSIFRAQDYLLTVSLALLVGLNFSMNIYAWKQRQLANISKSAASGTIAGFGGAFAAIVGTATCALCLAFLFGIVGLGIGSVAFVLKYQTFFLLGAIALVLFSLYFTARKVNRHCASNEFMNKQISIAIIIAAVVIGGAFYFSSPKTNNQRTLTGSVNQALAAKFEVLSKNGNSSCSGAFKDSIASMDDNARLQGSCCSPMSLHRYSEQVEGLKKYVDIIEIPPDPYDIQAGLAKKLMAHYDDQLTLEEQKAYDYAMQNSDEKGPCCCKCWRWFVYGGLGKYLIKNYGFTGEQVTQVWNLSDGCGGDSDHHHG